MDWKRILADRASTVEFSGIRKFFELAGRMTDPCDLSIGLPDYDVPSAVKRAAIKAIEAGHNRYTPTAGLPELRTRIAADLAESYGVEPTVLVTSGVSGGLFLALLASVNPGDEVIFTDPYFISYLQLVHIVGGRPVPVPVYPDFAFDADAVENAVTARTKAILINSPGNPTGRVMTETEVRAAAEIAMRHDLVLISDEIYQGLCYDGTSPSPMAVAPDHTILLGGFGKTYGMTGWRMGFAAGPAPILDEMTKFQQFTYVCAPSMAQHAAITALDTDMSSHRRDYGRKRDLVCDLLGSAFEFNRPGGGFFVFPRVPPGFEDATEFCQAAADRNVLVIPGSIFSKRDSHFRISFATSDEKLRRGCDVLRRLAEAGPTAAR